MRFLRFLLPLLALTMGACAHEAENTGATNASSVIVLPAAYAFEARAEAVAEKSPVTAGRISRFQREVIVPGGMDGELSPCAQNFDGIMDHLETLMAPQIEENNRIAAAQAAFPRYDF